MLFGVNNYIPDTINKYESRRYIVKSAGYEHIFPAVTTAEAIIKAEKIANLIKQNVNINIEV